MVGIARYPQILVLHMKRFRSVGMWHSKLHTHVHFPDQQLDMLPFFVETQQYVPAGHASYDLFGVIQHHGGMNGGHYVAYVRHLLTGEWYEYDDTQVQRVSFDFVKSREAYLLFYSMQPIEADTEQLKDTLLKYVKRATATPKPSLQGRHLRLAFHGVSFFVTRI
jgi:ubiquitin C-terminal hydrolase